MTKKTIAILIAILMLAFFSSCTHNKEDLDIISNNNNDNSDEIEDLDENKLIIVAFGDSLTEGYGLERDKAYPSQLEKELINRGYKLKVYNSGFSGETSSGALNRLDWVLSLNPDIVILNTGSNDGMRGINLEITENNIYEIVRKLKENDVKVILAGMKMYENLGEDYITQFEMMYPKIADDEGLVFIEYFLEGVEANESLNLNDGIHPNEKGYEIIVEKNILPVLIPVLDSYKK